MHAIVASEFLVRAASTTAVVVFVTLMAARLGPAIGGIIVGLPIVLAPGFFFLMREQEAQFVAETAAGSLYSLTATQVFLCVFIICSARLGTAGALTAAVLFWCLLAGGLSLLEHDLFWGTVLFIATTCTARLVGTPYIRQNKNGRRFTDWRLLLLRGIAAGVLVGSATLFAGMLGAALAGTLLAFPIGLFVILLSLQVDHGTDMAVHTAYAGVFGIVGLAAFCLTIGQTGQALPLWVSFCVALLASLLVTAVLILLARHTSPKKPHG